MVYQPPVGARDLFPLDVAQKQWIEERLQRVFHSWGYHRIITSTLERLDALMAGGAVEQSTVIQVHDMDGVGLRPELTASIARAAVTRMAGITHPQRLYYNANVFRRSDRSIQNHQQEFYQAGVELLGSDSVAADAEALLVLSDCLKSLQLNSCYLVLGDAGLTRSLLSPFPDPLRDQIREAIATLDRIVLETLPMSAELRDRALLLVDLRGQPEDVLQRVSSLDLAADQRAIVSNLKALIELLESSGATTPTLILDLSLVQVFDYYTGIVFEVVSATDAGKQIVGRGGRYDQLLSLYHPQREAWPGIGFVLNIEDLHQVLLPTGQLPTQTAVSDRLIVPTDSKAYGAAFAHAQALRQLNDQLGDRVGDRLRIEVELQGQNTSEAIREYAQQRGIAQIIWVSESGDLLTERVE